MHELKSCLTEAIECELWIVSGFAVRYDRVVGQGEVLVANTITLPYASVKERLDRISETAKMIASSYTSIK